MSETLKPPIRILLVDDHKSFLDGLAMVIGSQVPLMEVVGTAGNSGEAIESAERLSPDIILLDLDLGESSGLDILPRFAGGSGKVIILTGLRDSAVHEEAIVKGARGVLLKNESAKVILKAIQRVHAGEIWANNQILGRVLGKISQPKTSEEKEREALDRLKISSLTARETEIIKALVTFEASTNEEIAEKLFISKSTLKNHLTTIYHKLNIKNRIQLLRYALTHKIAGPPRSESK